MSPLLLPNAHVRRQKIPFEAESIKGLLFCCSYGKKKSIKSQGAGYGHGAVSHCMVQLICNRYTE